MIFFKRSAFKESLAVPADKVSKVEMQEISINLLCGIQWDDLGLLLVFGRIFQRLPTTPPDSLVEELLHSKQISTSATEWGKSKESTALKEYMAYNTLGRTEMVVCKSGFVICQQYPFLGASPDTYAHDPYSEEKYGLAESSAAHLNIKAFSCRCCSTAWLLLYFSISSRWSYDTTAQAEASILCTSTRPDGYNREKVVRLHCLYH